MAGFHKVCLRAGIHRFLTIDFVRCRRVEDYRRRLIKLPYAPAQVHAGTIRQPRIKQIKIEVLRARDRYSALDRRLGHNFIALLFEDQRHQLASVCMIFDIKDTRGFFHSHSP